MLWALFASIYPTRCTKPRGSLLNAKVSRSTVRRKESSMSLSPEQRGELLSILEIRFEKNMNRHHGLEWAKVQARLDANPDKWVSLYEMERTGGEPDVVGYDKKTGEYIFYDCSPESP